MRKSSSGRSTLARHQRDWVHKSANVLDGLPKSTHRLAKKAVRINEIRTTFKMPLGQQQCCYTISRYLPILLASA